MREIRRYSGVVCAWRIPNNGPNETRTAWTETRRTTGAQGRVPVRADEGMYRLSRNLGEESRPCARGRGRT